jgi:hypothetical protein
MGEPMAQERRDLEISLPCPDLANECFNKAVIEVHADDHRGEFILYYNVFARRMAGRLFGLNSGDWSIMLGGFALIGMVILLL